MGPIPRAGSVNDSLVTLEVGHDIIEEPRGFTGVMQRQDVWVGEIGGDLYLTQKPLRPQRAARSGRNTFTTTCR